jgi:hypothetical protein
MQTICKLMAGGLAMTLLINSELRLAAAEGPMACYMTKLTVENLSNQTVRISALRWLNSAGDFWYSTSADSGEITRGKQWQTEFCMTGIEGNSTFISVVYDIQLHDSKIHWSNDHLGKQVHVRLDSTPIVARLDIARRNLRS